MPLGRSASDPGILKPELQCTRRKPDISSFPFHRNSCELTDILLVARGSSSSGSTTWEPVRLTCHRGGPLSFQVLGQANELCLDVDWKKAFLAVPWQPLPMKGDPTCATAGKELFPFTLCYTPIRPRIRAANSALARRTVLLAATHEKTRSRWLNAFGRLARLPELHTCKSKDNHGNSNSLNSRMRHGTVLGDLHAGLELPQSCTSQHKRLPSFCSDHTKKHASSEAICDVHDRFTIDPLSVVPKQRTTFFERYLDRQVEIERLLEDRQVLDQSKEDIILHSDPGRCAQTVVPSEVQAAATSEQERSEDRRTTDGTSGINSDTGQNIGIMELPGFPILARTLSANLSGNILAAEQWSAGVLFWPPDNHEFSLSVCLLDPPDTHPLFIGVASPETDLSTVNCFTSTDVVLLHVGGGGVGVSEGSIVYALGKSIPVELPLAKPESRLTVHYQETYCEASGAIGQVRFTVGKHNAGGFHVGVKRSRKKHPAAWVPVVLLCMPGARVCVDKLQ